MKSRLTWILVAGFGASILLGLWGATQWMAWHLHYNVALGPALRVGDHYVFPPWMVLVWSARWGTHFPRLLDQVYLIIVGSMALAIVGMIVVRQVVTPGNDSPKPWPGVRDLRKAGLFSGTGTVVGEWKHQPLIYDGPEHQMVSGASRSGKGVGHVVPTILVWAGSALVYDVKGELYPLTSGWRARHGRVARFCPTDRKGARFNPLFEIRKGECEIRDTQNIVEMLVNPDGTKQNLDIWDTRAAELLAALILHQLYSAPDEEKTLAGVRNQLLDFDRTLRSMRTTAHIKDAAGRPCVHPEVARVAGDLSRKFPKLRESICATAAGYLTLWADPVVAAATATSDFRLGDLVALSHPMTLYIQPSPSDAPRLRPLVRLLLNQSCRALMESMTHDHLGRLKRHRLLLMLDEFPTLGRLDYFSVNLRQMAGYGIKAHMVVQSFNDIIEAYGHSNTILDNCHILATFASADVTTCQRISQMTGVMKEVRTSHSHPEWGGSGYRSVSESTGTRPLLEPGEVREISGDEQLLFVTGHKPMKVQKFRYYQHRAFQERILPPAPDLQAAPSAPPIPWLGCRGFGMLELPEGDAAGDIENESPVAAEEKPSTPPRTRTKSPEPAVDPIRPSPDPLPQPPERKRPGITDFDL